LAKWRLPEMRARRVPLEMLQQWVTVSTQRDSPEHPDSRLEEEELRAEMSAAARGEETVRMK
jgi:hypothetical protein